MPNAQVLYFCDCPRYCLSRKTLQRRAWLSHAQHRLPGSEYNVPYSPRAGNAPLGRPPSPVRSHGSFGSDGVLETGSIDSDLLSLNSHEEDYASGRGSPPPPAESPPPEEDSIAYDIESWRASLSPIAVVRTAQEFILHLQDATLDDSGLGPSLVDALLHPPARPLSLQDGPDGIDRDLMLSLRLVMDHTLSSKEVYERTRSSIMIAAPHLKVLHYDSALKQLEELSGVYVIEDDLCIDSCVAFTGPYADLLHCPKCGKPRYLPGGKKPQQRMSTFPIGPQIQAMHRHAHTAQLLDYWDQRTSALLSHLYGGNRIDLIDDTLCGSDILREMINGKLGPDDTALIVSLDGLQLYRNKQSGCWIWAFILVNLTPGSRYKKKYVLPGGSVPGPNKPAVMESVLFRTLQHISAINRNGGLPIWDAYRASEPYRALCLAEGRDPRPAQFLSTLYLMFATADAEAMPIWNGAVKHSGKKGCRLWCGLPGRRMPRGQRGGHYYPMLALPTDYNVAGCMHPDQPYDEPRPADPSRYLAELRRICNAKTASAYRKLRLDTGLVKPSILLGLWISPERPTILGMPNMFPCDNMHLLMNLAHHFITLWRGTFDCVRPDKLAQWEWATLRDDELWRIHGADIAACAHYMPSPFERPARNPAEKLNSGYKATEYINYFFVHGPVHFHVVLRIEYWQNYCLLVAGIRIIYQKRATREQLEEAADYLARFLKGFEELYIRRRQERMHLHTQIIHLVQHLAPEYLRVGPGGLHSQWMLERHIGNLTDELRLHSNPYQNLAAISLRRAQMNALKALCPELEHHAARERPPAYSLALDEGYVLLCPHQRKHTPMTRAENYALYVTLHEPPEDPELLEQFKLDADETVLKVRRWGGLQLPNGHKVWSEWALARVKSGRRREACNVKIDLANKPNDYSFARVRYFFQYQLNGETRTLAMIEQYGNAMVDLHDSSHGTVLVAERMGDDGLDVIDYSQVISLVTAPPIPESWQGNWEGKYYIAEKMGMDVTWFDLKGDDDGEAVLDAEAD
ncbi:hypothetical protein AURDEDRAFT_173986 [Auricularia subglabra TFB-10046 SS5]|uniref:Uncharacterized protein n=1 Tax=Auricularia subglabra (strain TFB-10046 / SS5) TaxID=717982 RepID=J0CZ69_AURST|nr:hypothetical protein AURDEDRAFT_173986 [Auricularia subglabra TFB-10046 SS5]